MGDEVDERILKFLKFHAPATTRQTAKAANLSWHMTQIRLFKLAYEKRLQFRRVGRQNEWYMK